MGELEDLSTIEMAPLGVVDSGGIPEPIDTVPSKREITQPSPGIAAEAAMLMRPRLAAADTTIPTPGIAVSGEFAARDGRDDIVTAASRPSALVPTPAVVMSYEVGDELATADLTVPSRAPIMTLLGVAPLEPARPKRVSMPAITNPITPLAAPRAPRAAASGSSEHAIAHVRRTWWDRVVGRLRAAVRSMRWAYRRRRGVRASLRRLPTHTS